MRNSIIEMSFLDDNFSSHINLIKEDIRNIDVKDIQIPSRYDINRLVILPVNPHLIYAYWFMQDSLKDTLINTYDNFQVVIKLNVEEKEEKEIEVNSLEGNWYINYHAPFKKVKAVLGLNNEGKFIPILYSNEIVMPSDAIFIEEDEYWYNKVNHTLKIKKADNLYLEELRKFAQENATPVMGISSFVK